MLIIVNLNPKSSKLKDQKIIKWSNSNFFRFLDQKSHKSLDKAKAILDKKFECNAYKLEDLIVDVKNYGRNYKECIGSQFQPCIGADGHVYVCTIIEAIKIIHMEIFLKKFQRNLG